MVDDDPQLRQMLVRLMSRYFDAVHPAHSIGEAERVLETHLVTHIVLDYNLGEHEQPGTDVVADWRARYSSIIRTILLTGCRVSFLDVPSAVDFCIVKGEDPLTLLSLLEN